MINLKKLLKEMNDAKDSNIASIEDTQEWKWVDVEHMFTMKFDTDNDSIFLLDNPPIKVYKIKKGPFVLEEPVENHEYIDFKQGTSAPIKPHGEEAFKTSKQIKKYQFKSFISLINFFDKYHQVL